MSSLTTADRCAAFRQLHHAGRPLRLPNAWDFASAAAFAAAGHPAVGTTSLGVAAAAGKPDATAAIRPETVALTRRLARLPVLLTVDIENGFSDDPGAVADLAEELHDAGAVGVNLEDGRPDGFLDPISLLVRKIEATRHRVPNLFLNVRTDTYWLATSTAEPMRETLRRATAYSAAGADGFFVPGVLDADTIRVIADRVPAPLNVLYRPEAHNVEELAALGVARVSTGSLLFRAALQAAVTSASQLNECTAQRRPAPLPSYEDVQQLIAPKRN